MTATRRDILGVLETLGQMYPDMRFGQLVINVANWAARVPDALWDLEDEQFLAAARKHLEKRTKEKGPTGEEIVQACSRPH